MAAAVAQFYFRFPIWWRRRLQKVRVYQQSKFHSYNSIRSWDITISGLEKKRLPYWNSTSGFDYDRITAADISSCTSLANFIQIHGRKNDLMSIFKMADLRHLEF